MVSLDDLTKTLEMVVFSKKMADLSPLKQLLTCVVSKKNLIIFPRKLQHTHP